MSLTMNSCSLLSLAFLFLSLCSAALSQSTSHDSIAACFLVPTISYMGRNPEDTENLMQQPPPYAQRVRLHTSHQGRIHFFYDSKEQIPTEARGELPPTLSVSPEHPRAFHVHELGDVRTNTSQGGHFVGAGELASPYHAVPGFLPRHIGDMGNLKSSTVNIRNEGGYNNTFLWTLIDSPETGVLGRAVVIHEKVDQGVSAQPSGASGTRLFHCVLGIANSTGIRRVSGDTTPDISLNKARAPTGVTDFAVADLYSAASTHFWDKLYGRALIQRTPQGNVKVEVRVCGLQQLQGSANPAGFRVDIHQFGDLTGDEIASNVGPVLTRVYREAPNVAGAPGNTSVPIEEGAAGEGEVFHEIIGTLGEMELQPTQRGIFTGEMDDLDFEEHTLGRSLVVKREGSESLQDRLLVGVIGIANIAADEGFERQVWKDLPCFSQ